MSLGIPCLDHSRQTTQVLALVFRRGVLGSSVEKNGLETELIEGGEYIHTFPALTRSSAAVPIPTCSRNLLSYITDLEGSRGALSSWVKARWCALLRFPSLMETSFRLQSSLEGSSERDMKLTTPIDLYIHFFGGRFFPSKIIAAHPRNNDFCKDRSWQKIMQHGASLTRSTIFLEDHPN